MQKNISLNARQTIINSNLWKNYGKNIWSIHIRAFVIMSMEHAECESGGRNQPPDSELWIFMMNSMLPCHHSIQYNVCVQTMGKFHTEWIRFSVTEFHSRWWLSALMLKCQNYFHIFFIRMKTNNHDSHSVRIRSINNIINWEILQKRAALIIAATRLGIHSENTLAALAWKINENFFFFFFLFGFFMFLNSLPVCVSATGSLMLFVSVFFLPSSSFLSSFLRKRHERYPCRFCLKGNLCIYNSCHVVY